MELSTGPVALGDIPPDFSSPGITGVDETFAKVDAGTGFELITELVDELLEVLVVVAVGTEVVTGFATVAVVAVVLEAAATAAA